MNTKTVSKAIGLGLLSALFFTSTYLLNRSMALEGSYWLWSASLRYLITFPVLFLMVAFRGGIAPLYAEMKAHFGTWFLWGTVGFGLFYVCLAYAGETSPAWLVAGSFQTTIVAGLLLSPLIYNDERARIPGKALFVSLFIIAGVFVSQFDQMQSTSLRSALIGMSMVFMAAALFPLGNRKILLHMETSPYSLDAFQRVLGMTAASLPFWCVMSGLAWARVGMPPLSQVAQSGGVALSSGIIASVLFFRATGMVKDQPLALGAVEATQSAEIVIALFMEMLFLGIAQPSWVSLSGMVMILVGMGLYAIVSTKK